MSPLAVEAPIITTRDLLRRVPGMTARQAHYWRHAGILRHAYVCRVTGGLVAGGQGRAAVYPVTEVLVAAVVATVSAALGSPFSSEILRMVADAAREGQTSVSLSGGVTIGWVAP